MSSDNELFPLLERAKAHMECASKIFIDIEKKLAGIHPPGKTKKGSRVTPRRTAEVLAKSMSRRKITPRN